MLPAFLITFREVIEATLIVATILGILTKLGQHKSIKTVWIATASAAIISVLLLGVASVAGIQIQKLYSGATEEIIEGILMVVSAIFITWAVFFLHKYFARHKAQLLQKVKSTIETNAQKGLFALVFTAVFREGFEIVLFLSTIYLSSNPQAVFSGFGMGLVAGLIVSFGFFSATLKLPVFYAFRATSILLILFAAGLLGRGIHEFTEVGLLPELSKVSLAFLPDASTFAGGTIKAMFGLSPSLDLLQAIAYVYYIAFMTYTVFVRPARQK